MGRLLQVYTQETQPTNASVGDLWIRGNGRTEVCRGIGTSGPIFSPLGPATQAETPVQPTQAHCTITTDNTDVADADTVTVLGVTYRFKNTLAQNLDVHRTGTADTTLGNLAKIIMDNGVPDTDYKLTGGAGDGTAARADVTSSTVSSHAITLTLVNLASQRGTLGNALTEPSGTITGNHLAFTAWSGGVDGTTGEVGTITADDSNIYVCVGENGQWKKAALSTF